MVKMLVVMPVGSAKSSIRYTELSRSTLSKAGIKRG